MLKTFLLDRLMAALMATQYDMDMNWFIIDLRDDKLPRSARCIPVPTPVRRAYPLGCTP
ncbi:MAG: hypothetical protein ACP5JJ_07970 [Anaerolineae bacterium]